MGKRKREVIELPVDQILAHPDNYRAIRTDTRQFEDLLESIRACGVIEPVLVRKLPPPDPMMRSVRQYELLSGHRRWTAACKLELETIPAIDRGILSDAEAFDVMCLANLHQDLTPLEEGRRVAIWLDKYGQDARAVASKLGKTERWVHEHAQIDRGLSADWRRMATETSRVDFDRWTPSHWIVIARLPARIQAAEVKKFQSGAYCSFDRWTVKQLEERVKLATFLLARAPFDTKGCAKCLSRSGVQPLLWADSAEGATGSKERCLEKKCWDRKCQKAAMATFKQLAADKGLDGAVPLSTLKKPRGYDYRKGEEYRKNLSAVRRTHKGLLTADEVKVVKKGTKGAVPAIVVAGKGKGGVTYIKVTKPKEPARGPRKPTAAERKAQQERERWEEAFARAADAIVQNGADSLPASGVLLMLAVLFFDGSLWSKDREGFLADAATQAARRWKDPDAFERWARAEAWRWIAEEFRGGLQVCNGTLEEDCATFALIAPMFGVDLQAIYDGLGTVQTCRVCGCTDDDCSQCVERTGEACTWVEPDLCSACAQRQGKKETGKG